MLWSEERIAELKSLFDERLSAGQIAKRMQITRNSVIGKLYRMGLRLVKVPLTQEQIQLLEEKRKERNKQRMQIRRTFRPDIHPKPRAVKMTLPPEAVESLNIPFADLRDFSSMLPNQCRYIHAEPAEPNYLACGNETAPGQSYCAHCGPMTRASFPKTQQEWAVSNQLRKQKYLREQRKVA